MAPTDGLKRSNSAPLPRLNTQQTPSTSHNVAPSTLARTPSTPVTGQVRQPVSAPPTPQQAPKKDGFGERPSPSANSNQLKGNSAQRSPQLPSVKLGAKKSAAAQGTAGAQKTTSQSPEEALSKLHEQGIAPYEDLNKVLSGSQLKSSNVFGLSHLKKNEDGSPLNDAQKMAHLKDPNNWHPDRIPVHQELYDKRMGAAQKLSEAMAKKGDANTLVAVMGNTAAGKSTSLKNLDDFKHLTSEHLQGAFNPDPIKYELEKKSKGPDGKNTIGTQEVHTEGTVISLRAEQDMLNKPGSSLLFDKRFAGPNDFKDLLKTAETTGKGVKAVDIDSDLTRSCVRVLGRAPGGEDPRVPFNAVATGFDGTRKYRNDVINGRADQVDKRTGQTIPGFKGAKDNDNVKSYDLFVPDANGNAERVAYKRDGVWHGPQTPQHQEMYNRAVHSDPADVYGEVDRVRGTKIDNAFIQQQVSQVPDKFKASTQSALEAYKGHTLEEALDAHSKKLY